MRVESDRRVAKDHRFVKTDLMRALCFFEFKQRFAPVWHWVAEGGQQIGDACFGVRQFFNLRLVTGPISFSCFRRKKRFAASLRDDQRAAQAMRGLDQ